MPGYLVTFIGEIARPLKRLVLPLCALLAPIVTPAVLDKPEEIRGMRNPIYHLYLQSALPRGPDDPPSWGPRRQPSPFDVVAGTIRSASSSSYLSVVGSDDTSYKALAFGDASGTDA